MIRAYDRFARWWQYGRHIGTHTPYATILAQGLRVIADRLTARYGPGWSVTVDGDARGWRVGITIKDGQGYGCGETFSITPPGRR